MSASLCLQRRGLAAALFAGFSLAVLGAATTAPAAASPFTLEGSMPVPGKGQGGEFDHFAVDVKTQRLFVADEGHGALQVYNLKTRTLLTTVGEGVFHDPHSIVFRADAHRLLVTDGLPQFGAVRIFDSDSLKLLKTIELPPMADWSGYDPSTHQLWVSQIGVYRNLSDSNVEVINADSGEVVSRFTVDDNVITDLSVDPSRPVVYTGLRTKNLIAVIDRTSHQVVARWPVSVAGCGLGHMGEDPDHHRLFVNCRSGVMLVYDTQSGKEVAQVPVPQHTDELQYIRATRRLYVLGSGAPKNGQASLAVIQQLDPDHYQPLGETPSSQGARTGIFVPELHRYYVGAPKTAAEPPKILVFRTN